MIIHPTVLADRAHTAAPVSARPPYSKRPPLLLVTTVEAAITATLRHLVEVVAAEPHAALAATGAAARTAVADNMVAADNTAAALATNTTIFPRPGRVSFLSGLFLCR